MVLTTQFQKNTVSPNGTNPNFTSRISQSHTLRRVPNFTGPTVTSPNFTHQLHEAVRQISGALVTDSRGIYDASVKSESPQKGLGSPQSGVELEMACDDALRCGTIMRWSHGGAMLADTLTKRSALARRTFELFLGNNQRWRLVYDPKFQSERRRTRAGLARLVDFDLGDSAADATTTTRSAHR